VFCLTSGTVAGIDLDGNVLVSPIHHNIDQSGTKSEGINNLDLLMLAIM